MGSSAGIRSPLVTGAVPHAARPRGGAVGAISAANSKDALRGRNVWRRLFLRSCSKRATSLSMNFGPPRGIFCYAFDSDGDTSFAKSTSSSETELSFYPWPDQQRPRICILGGGFGGLYTALKLESLVWPSEKKPQVVLVDQSDRFVFKPMLYELLSGEVDVWEIAPTFSELLKGTNVQFVKDRVKLLRLSDNFNNYMKKGPGTFSRGTVHLESGTVIEYDWLVLALGAESRLDAVPGSAEFALAFSTLEDALKIDRELKLLERERFGRSSSPISVAIVGCGYSGVELAATVSERLQDKGVVQAINVENSICPSAPEGNRKAALKVFQSRNVKLLLGYFVSCIEEHRGADYSASIDDGRNNSCCRKLHLTLRPAQRGVQGLTLDADLVLWTVGSKGLIPQLQPYDEPNPIPLNSRGQAETDETLQVRGHPHIFAIGDSAALRDPSGKLLPATAQVAFQEADFTAWNLWAAINNRPLLPFRYQNLGEMMTLGMSDAAITPGFIDGVTLDGPIGHAARKLVYCLRMPTDEQRIKVGISWLTKAAVGGIASLQTAIANSVAS